MATKKRLEKIRQLVINDKKVSVSNLSEDFSVTEETIRRDLEKLEEEGLISRTYGGAIYNPEKSIEGVYYFKRAANNILLKQAIAKKAIDCINDFNTIAFDTSTTSMELIRLLGDRDDLTIVTNSSVVLNEMNQTNLKIVSTGGILNSSSLSLQGPVALSAIKNYHLDALVMSCKGISKSKGIYDTDEMEAEIKRQLISQSSVVILLVDHTKFDKVAFVKVTDFPMIHLLVTDTEPDAEWMSLLRKNNIDVVFQRNIY